MSRSTQFRKISLAILLGMLQIWVFIGGLRLPSDVFAAAPVFVPGNPTLTPSANQHTILPDATIAVTYNEAIDPSTVTTKTFVVQAMETGRLEQTYTVNGGMISLTPTDNLKPGELVQVSATTQTLGVTSGIGPSEPTVWQFRVAVQGGSGFFDSNGQSLGNRNSTSVALGDLDGDGDLDAYVTNNENEGNRVWRNDGSGDFSLYVSSMGSQDSEFVALGDLDGDNDLDAFVANFNEGNRVWLNRGNGRFDDSGQSLGNYHSVGVALGDLDGDGDLDAYEANFSRQPNRVWLNDGTGVFTDSGQLLGEWKSEVVALGDVDGDGDIDAFVGNREKSNRVWVNDGTGVFTDNNQSTGTSNSLGAAIGDLDGDGDLDAFIGNETNQPNQVFFNNGGQQGGQAGDYSNSGQGLGSSQTYAVALGDLDGDGDLDGFAANYDGQANQVWRNDGSGSMTSTGQGLGSSSSYGVALGDLDGDGDLDAFVANRNSQANRVWLNRDRVDIAVTISVSPETTTPGQPVTYTLAYTNQGPIVAKDGELVFVVPNTLNGVTTQSVPPLSQLSGPDFRWDVGDLAVDATGIVTITGVLDARLPVGSLTQTATITNDILDLHVENNSVYAELSVVNVPPVAGDDTATVDEDSQSNQIDVLNNDDDVNEDSLTISIARSLITEQAVVTTTGTHLYYNPAPDFAGQDIVSYTVVDGNGGLATALVTVTVNNVNDDPRPQDDTATVNEDSQANIVVVLDNDLIAPDTAETLSLISVSLADFGTVNLVDSEILTYTPQPDYFGTDSFTYTVSDGQGGSASAMVTMTIQNVNDPPVALDDSYTISEDVSAVFDPLSNDQISPDSNETLSLIALEQGKKGIASIQQGQSIAYTPALNVYGTDIITTIIADNNGGVATATVIITINPVNDPPTAFNDTFTLWEDSPPSTIDVLDNDSILPDENEQLIISMVGQSLYGTVSISPSQQHLIYQPNADFSGSDTISYTIQDDNLGQTSALVTVTVLSINDPPQANDDLVLILRNSTNNWLDVLANDTSAPDQNEALSIISVEHIPQMGEIVIAPSANGLIFTPTVEITGTAIFSYTIDDGQGGQDTAMVTLLVGDFSLPPQANHDQFSINEDTQEALLSVLLNDTDPNTDDILSLFAVGSTEQGGTVVIVNSTQISYSPLADFFGTDTFTYTVTDNQGLQATASVTVNVSNVNDLPIAIGDVYTMTEDDGWLSLPVLSNDTFAPDQNEQLTVIDAIVSTTQGSVQISGTNLIFFKPAENFSGTAIVDYTINDGMPDSNASAEAVITVLPVNDAPQALADHLAVLVNSAQVLDVMNNDADVDADPLQISQVQQPSHGVTSTNGGTVVYVPMTGFMGIDTFEYTITDGDLTADAIVTVTVRTNTPPVVTTSPDLNATATIPYQYQMMVTDAEDQANLVITALEMPDWLSLTDQGSGMATLSGTPSVLDVGPTEVVLQVQDAFVTQIQSFTILVDEADPGPGAQTLYFPALNR
ncbi:MAG: Ig-like domain-containing protein [Chloroflexota bacterium]